MLANKISARRVLSAIAAVDVMAMDYGSGFPGDMATLAEQSVTSTVAQVRSVWTMLTPVQALAKMAATRDLQCPDGAHKLCRGRLLLRAPEPRRLRQGLQRGLPMKPMKPMKPMSP